MEITPLTPARLAALDRDNRASGLIAPSGGGFGGGSRSLAANRAYALRIAPSRDMAITLIAFAVITAAGSDDACSVGLYDSTGARLATSGAVTGKLNSAGVKTVPVAYTLLAGKTYYAALSCGAVGTTAATLAGIAYGGSDAMALFGATVGQSDAGVKDTAHPLPSTLASFTWTGSTTTHLLLAVREV